MRNLRHIGAGKELLDMVIRKNGTKSVPTTRQKQLEVFKLKKATKQNTQ